MAMRRSLFAAAVLLISCNAGLAQVSTMGSTAMGLPSTPGTIVTSPLNGPSPFSATTQPGTPDTTLAPVPLASDPTTPGTVVTCSTPTGQIAPGTPVVPMISMSALGGATGTMPSMAAAMGTIAGPTTPSIPTMVPSTMAPLGTISTPVVGSTTGTISPASPLGSSSTTVCSSTPGGPPTNGASLPLSIPEIPSSPAPGTIQPVVAELATTSIDPATTVVPTPNTSACAESMTMTLATPGMMAPANATGATATPGVTPPSGC
jgi:hypothetical protein